MKSKDKINMVDTFFQGRPPATVEEYTDLLYQIGLVPCINPGAYGEESRYVNSDRQQLGIYQTPAQFAPFLKWLETYRGHIWYYTEIGMFTGGQSIIMDRYFRNTLLNVFIEINHDYVHPQVKASIEGVVLYADSKTVPNKYKQHHMVFIDGDHSYEGVKEDWLRFGKSAEMVVFHDMNNPTCPGVCQLWKELRQLPEYVATEFTRVKGGADDMGIGVLVRKEFDEQVKE